MPQTGEDDGDDLVRVVSDEWPSPADEEPLHRSGEHHVHETRVDGRKLTKGRRRVEPALQVIRAPLKEFQAYLAQAVALLGPPHQDLQDRATFRSGGGLGEGMDERDQIVVDVTGVAEGDEGLREPREYVAEQVPSIRPASVDRRPSDLCSRGEVLVLEAVNPLLGQDLERGRPQTLADQPRAAPRPACRLWFCAHSRRIDADPAHLRFRPTGTAASMTLPPRLVGDSRS